MRRRWLGPITPKPGPMAGICAHFGVHYRTVSHAVKGFEQRKNRVEESWNGLDC
ncbi:MAG: hypothetical protein L0Y43_09925 [Methylococcaceae bacterium]|nr:hypothetical protein [Methylococcaceae bacterium]